MEHNISATTMSTSLPDPKHASLCQPRIFKLLDQDTDGFHCVWVASKERKTALQLVAECRPMICSGFEEWNSRTIRECNNGIVE